MEHHILDPYPIPKDKGALFVNEPWLADKSLNGYRTGRLLQPRRRERRAGGEAYDFLR